MSRTWTPLLVAAVAFAAEWILSGLRPTIFDNYVWLTDAWLHGHLWIHFPGDWIDAVPYHGRAYVVEAPLPGLLLLPFVAFAGTNANETLVSAVVAALACGGGWALARRAGAEARLAALLTVFVFIGTDVLYCGITGDVWLLAHVCAACFSIWCLAEMFGRRRSWIVALCSIAAGFSRYPLLLAIPVYFGWLMAASTPSDHVLLRRRLFGFATVFLPAFGVWVWYNMARWGTPFDAGYTIWYHVMDPRSIGTDPIMSLRHVPMQLHLFFTTPPNLLGRFPWVAPQRFGTSLTYLCPALLVALAAPRRRETAWLWLLFAVTAVPSLAYYDIGGMQLGTRHALDFEPFLFALIALAVAHRASWWKLALITYSTIAGAWMLIVWRFFPQAIL